MGWWSSIDYVHTLDIRTIFLEELIFSSLFPAHYAAQYVIWGFNSNEVSAADCYSPPPPTIDYWIQPPSTCFNTNEDYMSYQFLNWIIALTWSESET